MLVGNLIFLKYVERFKWNGYILKIGWTIIHFPSIFDKGIASI